ncbi:hypothetical protein B0T22DRAFT_142769 [Podospora appendiculata]|uniref:Uncharacterized protein n=1 Tax=Podospora appendiculata TaxID=314037 RepID=A0AAE0X8F6_9PEZI|nr:hypothetical protein B0T22DRAFT_142769 [Podospora appendiculata]
MVLSVMTVPTSVTSSSPSTELDDEVQAADQVPNPPGIRSVSAETGYPTPSPSLNIEVWGPVKQPSPSRRAAVNVWKERTTSFFDGLPRSEDQWRKKRQGVSLLHETDILSVVDHLTTGRLSDNSSLTGHTAAPDLQGALEAFAQKVGSNLLKVAGFYHASRFLSFIFIATCSVALYEGHPICLVNTAQRKFLTATRGNCRKGDNRLAKDRSAVLWLLREMQIQFRRGLRHRAFELFLLESKEIDFYTQCPKESDQHSIFTNLIPLCETPNKIPPAEIQASLPFWIPFFGKLHVGDQWSYSTI